jgi:hypothetical protein
MYDPNTTPPEGKPYRLEFEYVRPHRLEWRPFGQWLTPDEAAPFFSDEGHNKIPFCIDRINALGCDLAYGPINRELFAEVDRKYEVAQDRAHVVITGITLERVPSDTPRADNIRRIADERAALWREQTQRNLDAQVRAVLSGGNSPSRPTLASDIKLALDRLASLEHLAKRVADLNPASAVYGSGSLASIIAEARQLLGRE